MDKETMFEYIQRLKLAVITLFKWLFCSVVCGCFIGSVGACISPDAWLCRQPAR